jgi:hypothetical protein
MTEPQHQDSTQATPPPEPEPAPPDQQVDLVTQFKDPELVSYAYKHQDQPDLTKAVTRDGKVVTSDRSKRD